MEGPSPGYLPLLGHLCNPGVVRACVERDGVRWDVVAGGGGGVTVPGADDGVFDRIATRTVEQANVTMAQLVPTLRPSETLTMSWEVCCEGGRPFIRIQATARAAAASAESAMTAGQRLVVRRAIPLGTTPVELELRALQLSRRSTFDRVSASSIAEYARRWQQNPSWGEDDVYADPSRGSATRPPRASKRRRA